MKQWTIRESKKYRKTEVKEKIDKKKIAPKPVFRIKPPFLEKTDIKKKILGFFDKKSFSDGNLLRNLKGFELKSTILRISSKQNMLFSKENKEEIVRKDSSVIYCRKEIKPMNNRGDPEEIRSKYDLKRQFSNKIPMEFLSDDKSDDKTIDVLIEMTQNP